MDKLLTIDNKETADWPNGQEGGGCIKTIYGVVLIAASILTVSCIVFPAYAQSGSSQYNDEYDKNIRINGQITVVDVDRFTWDPQNFAGFYYDLDSDSGAETLTASLNDGKLSGSIPYGLTYQTMAQEKSFKFEDWGSYSVIGFLGMKCFAGCLEGDDLDKNFLAQKSLDKSSLAKGQLEEVLLDNDDETTITSSSPLMLNNGYKLNLKSISIDGNDADIELYKDDRLVDSKKIQPSKVNADMSDKTYYYTKNVGDQNNLVIIAVHFKNAFMGADQGIGTIDGIFQISDEPISVMSEAVFGKMTISDVTDDHIAMDNRENTITLSKNKDFLLGGDLHLLTADQRVVDDSHPLRYYPCMEINQPGNYDIRGTVATGDFTWASPNFAGFYYNPDDDTGTETFEARISESEHSSTLSGDDPYGLIYRTTAQKNSFRFQDWGSYYVIGFLEKKCFAGYPGGSDSENGLLSEKSSDQNSLAKGQLEEVLLDTDAKTTISADSPLELKDGYELELSALDANGEKAFVQLRKDGKVVDSKQLDLGKNVTLATKTYYYKETVGNIKSQITIAVHFKNAFVAAQKIVAIVDGVWQLSHEPIMLQEGTEFDKMSVQSVDLTAESITFANKDNPITLSRNKDTVLMGDIRLRTADSDLLRYYIYKERQIKYVDTD